MGLWSGQFGGCGLVGTACMSVVKWAGSSSGGGGVQWVVGDDGRVGGGRCLGGDGW